MPESANTKPPITMPAIDNPPLPFDLATMPRIRDVSDSKRFSMGTHTKRSPTKPNTNEAVAIPEAGCTGAAGGGYTGV